MTSQRNCRACGEAFVPNHRSQATQAFCPASECQRARRAEAQRKRRKASAAGGYLTSRLKPSEAAWLRKNPLIIGLISVLIGSTDWQDIEAFCAAAILRGKRVLDGTLVAGDLESPEKQAPNEEKPPRTATGAQGGAILDRQF